MNAVTIIIATSASLAVMVAIVVGTLLARRSTRGGPATQRASGRGDGARRWRADAGGGEGAGHGWDSSDSGGWDGGGCDGGGGGGGGD